MISSMVERSARATSIFSFMQKHDISCLRLSALLPSEPQSLKHTLGQAL